MAIDSEPSLSGMEKFGNALSNISAGVRVDVDPIRKLTSAFGDLNKQLLSIEKQMKLIQKEADKATASLSKTSKAGAGTTTTSSGTQMAIDVVSSSPPISTGAGGGGGAFTALKSQLGSMGGGGKAGLAAAGASIVASTVQAGIDAIDNRVDAARGYALAADRMSVLYQQMTGKSQLDVQSQYRAPLMNYRLGYGGAEALLGLQARTGINANQQGGSVEALRTYSGYSLSAADGANMLESLAQAPTANRMFMMGGGGLIGIGGKQNSMQSVLQNIVRTAGLTDERLVDGAFAPGSMTRARLTNMGITGDMQDTVLQYAKSNIQFREKGGVGMYDASKKKDRELMGIEGNFATQVEETDRVRNKRDEQFYRRQADNYADLEKQTQKLIKVFGALEDKLSGLIGMRTSNRISSTIGGGIGTALGGFIGGLLPGGPLTAMVGAGIGNMLGTAVGGMIGDPVGSSRPKGIMFQGGQRGDPAEFVKGNDAAIRVPTYGGKSVTLDQVKQFGSFKGMHPNMQDRVLKLLRANPKIGFGEGKRSVEDQKKMFLSRYVRTNKQTNIQWDGSYWEHQSGAPAAPPGRSMHGIGLAADLYLPEDGSQNAWVDQNAGKFGLKNFTQVNGEPWHVQPAELPSGFGEYVKGGAPWGTGDMPITQDDRSVIVNSRTYEGVESDVGGHSMGAISYSSISDRVASGIGGLSGGGGGGHPSNSNRIGSTEVSLSTDSQGALSGEDVARLLYNAGFRGNDLIKMVAIAQRESHFKPTAYNGNRKTGDDSYGLFQINMLGAMGPERRKAIGISDNKQLFDPLTNIKAAKWLFDAGKKSNNNGFYHWGDYANSGPGSSSGGTNMAQASAYVKNAQLGDPVFSSAAPATSSGTVSVRGGHTFNITIPVTVMNNNNSDIQALAKNLARAIKREIEFEDMRGR